MTNEEKELVLSLDHLSHENRASIARLIEISKEHEREACAEIAEQAIYNKYGADDVTCRWIAQAIRERGGK